MYSVSCGSSLTACFQTITSLLVRRIWGHDCCFPADTLKPDHYHIPINFPVWGQLLKQLRHCAIRQLYKQVIHLWKTQTQGKKRERRGTTEQLWREETWLHPVQTHGHLRSSVWFWMWFISAGRSWSLIQATVTEVKPLKAPACCCRMSHSQDESADSKLSPTEVICCHAGVRKGLIGLWKLWIETLWLKIYS